MPFEEESFTISVNAAGGLLQLRKLLSRVNASAYSRQSPGNRSSALSHTLSPLGRLTSVRVHFLSHIRSFGILHFHQTTGHHVTPIQNLTDGRNCKIRMSGSAWGWQLLVIVCIDHARGRVNNERSIALLCVKCTRKEVRIR